MLEGLAYVAIGGFLIALGGYVVGLNSASQTLRRERDFWCSRMAKAHERADRLAIERAELREQVIVLKGASGAVIHDERMEPPDADYA